MRPVHFRAHNNRFEHGKPSRPHQCLPGRSNGGHPARFRPPDHLWQAPRPGVFPGRFAGLAGHRTRRPGGHRFAQRPARDRQFSRRLHRRNSGAAQSRLPRRRVQVLSGRHLRQNSAVPARRRAGGSQSGGGKDSGLLARNGRDRLGANRRCGQRPKIARSFRRRRGADPAHQRQHGTAQAGAHPPSQSGRLGAEHRASLLACAGRRRAVRDAPVSRPRAGGVHHFDTCLRWNGGCAVEIQSAFVLADRPRLPGDVVFGCADDSLAAAFARRPGASGRMRRIALHPLL